MWSSWRWHPRDRASIAPRAKHGPQTQSEQVRHFTRTGIIVLTRPVGTDLAADAVEGARRKLRQQDPRRIDRTGHAHLALGDATESGLAQIGLGAHQTHEPHP